MSVSHKGLCYVPSDTGMKAHYVTVNARKWLGATRGNSAGNCPILTITKARLAR